MRIPAFLLLFLLALLPAQAAGWSRHENRDLIQGSRAGWALETPPEWVAIPDVKPAWPLGGGFRDPSGQVGVVVTWTPQVPGGEIEGLSNRGFAETADRVAGHAVRMFSRAGAESLQKLVYLALPEGTYRLMLFATPGSEETLDKVLRSFQLIRGISPTAPTAWNQHQDGGAGYRLSYPGDWSLKTASQGFELSDGTGPVLRASLRKAESVAAEAGQSFRGFARAIGRTTIPGATSLERFEPVDAGGSTGYLAVWKLEDGKYFGPVVYLPLAGKTWRALELLLLRPAAGEAFYRVLDTFLPAAPAQAQP